MFCRADTTKANSTISFRYYKKVKQKACRADTTSVMFCRADTTKANSTISFRYYKKVKQKACRADTASVIWKW
jgi:hypothetical protein